MRLRSEDGSAQLSLSVVDATLPPLPMSSVELHVEATCRVVTTCQCGWFDLEALQGFADALERALAEDTSATLVAFSEREVRIDLERSGGRIPSLRVALAGHTRPVADAPMHAGVVWLETWELRGLAEWLRKIAREDYLADRVALGWPDDAGEE